MNPICSVDGCDREARKKTFCGMHYQRFRNHGDPLAGRNPNGKNMEWVHAHVNYAGDDCLIWPFGKITYGYGAIYCDGIMRLVHELMLEMTVGIRPHPMSQARHLCGRGQYGCVNPRHLVWGTKKENAQDRSTHGTQHRGERTGSAKLTETDVHEIRKMIEFGFLQREIGRQYGVTDSAVRNIKSGKNWGWLETLVE